MYCGTCIASCPVNVLYHTEEQKPTIKGICVLCQLCYFGCPRVDLPRNDIEKEIFNRSRTEDENSFGIIKEAYFGRSTDKEIRERGQDGGVTSTLLIQALEDRLIDVAITTKTNPEKCWRPEPSLAFTSDEVVEACGSKYTVAGSVSGLAEAAIGFPDSKIGYVGVPCQIEGIRKIRYSNYSNRKIAENLKLAIGVFCLNSFSYKKLLTDYLQEQKHIDLRSVTKFDIRKGKLILHRGKEQIFEVGIPEIKDFVLPGCRKCQDFTAELADISIGASDAPIGWSTILIRTETGSDLFAKACEKNKIEFKTIKRIKTSLKSMIRLSEKKRRRQAPYLKE